MASTTPIPAARPEPAAEPAQRQPAPTAAPAAAVAGDRPPLTRLMIEEVEGRYVYKVVDRNTGRILAELPRQQVQQMGGLEDYSAGAVVNTKA